MPTFSATVRVIVEGTVDVEAPDAEAAYKMVEEMDYVTAMNGIDVEIDELEILGDVEEMSAGDGE